MLHFVNLVHYFCLMNKELLKTALISARTQFQYDIECARRISFVYETDKAYNNHSLYATIIKLITPFCIIEEKEAVELISNFIFLNTLLTIDEILEILL